MNTVTSLQSRKQEQQYTQLVERVTELKKLAQPEFRALVVSGKVIGKWDDSVWTYRNRTIYFTHPIDKTGNPVTGKTPSENKVLIEGVWADVYRLFILHKIKGHKGNPKTIASLMAFTAWLGEYYQYDIQALHKLNQDKLDALIPMLESKFSARGPFERYKTIVSFVKKFLIPNKLCRSFAPSIKMINPALDRADVTSKESAKARENKFNENIDSYIGIVKQRFDEDVRRLARGEIAKYPEPKPHYDELRLLAMPFFLALGLRVGEVCRLHKDCLGYDEITGKWFLRVLTEKGELANVRPIPRKWQDVIIQSHKRILEITEPFRKFAKQVELHKEQAFINALSFENRNSELTTSLLENGYDPDMFFCRSEIGKTGDVHSSGLTYNSLRENEYRASPYAPSFVGLITSITGNSGGRKQKLRVYSKAVVAAIAMDYFRSHQQRIYQDNAIDEKVNETISSSSYSFEMPFSDFLFIVKEDMFDASGRGHGFVPTPIYKKNILMWLSHDSSRAKTVFQRYDVRNDDGKIVNIRSHQFRHWLTTALLRSGKNESMIDRFMGRKLGQTRHYDHRTPKERAEGLRSRYLAETPPDDVLGRRVKRMRENGVPHSEIENALNHTLSVVHYTPWGTCNRDLDVSPCEKGMMCLRGEDGQGCQHFGIDPDDEEARQSIINTKAHYEAQLSVLLPNYENLLHTLNRQEPLDQHVRYCIDTIKGCDNALRAYERANSIKDNTIPVVQVFKPEEAV